jgi:SAM-dependent methyltransferase
MLVRHTNCTGPVLEKDAAKGDAHVDHTPDPPHARNGRVWQGRGARAILGAVTSALPLTLGEDDDFARVAEYLHGAAYDAATVCGRLGVPDLFAADDLPRDGLALASAEDDPLAFLVRTFLLLQPVSEAALRARLDGPTRAAFERLGLLAPEPDGMSWAAPVLLYPVGHLHVVSDRHRDRDGLPVTPPPDAVFPAIFPGSMLFRRLLPEGAYEEALDLGAGTGIGALVLSRRVRHVVAADLTERATHFARFNQRLNACPNVEAVTGDLYEPVADRTFDCIVSHPPYVPSPDDAFVFRDGGATGERIVRRMIVELPGVLRPGGVFCGVCAGWDTVEGTLEERIRVWLGPWAGEFDLLLAVETALEPVELAARLVRPGFRGERGSASVWEARFREAGLVSHVYGALVLGRRGGAGAPATLRTWLGETTRGADLERAVAMLGDRAAQRVAGSRDRVLDTMRPRIAEDLVVHVTYAPRDGALKPAEVILETRQPFRSRMQIDPWMLTLLGAFDGTRTPGAVRAALRAAGALPRGVAQEDVRAFLEMLLERGYAEARE